MTNPDDLEKYRHLATKAGASVYKRKHPFGKTDDYGIRFDFNRTFLAFIALVTKEAINSIPAARSDKGEAVAEGEESITVKWLRGAIEHVESITPNYVKTRPQQATPAGYALVPIEPTKEMKIAGDNAGFWCGDKYKAMLSAAPTAPIDNVAEALERQEENAYMFCNAVTEIINGIDKGEGLSYEPWATTRKRLIYIMQNHKLLIARDGKYRFHGNPDYHSTICEAIDRALIPSTQL
jgi:hypothetical protein